MAALVIAILAVVLVAAYLRAREQRLPVPLVALVARRGLSIDQAEQLADQPVALALARCALCRGRRLCRSRGNQGDECPNRAFLAQLERSVQEEHP